MTKEGTSEVKVIAVTGRRSPVCIIATLMREHGTTGVQTHMAMARQALTADGFIVSIVTPFTGRRLFRNPTFALRRIFEPLSGPLDVFWYRYGHYLYLKFALRDLFRQDPGIEIIYAQCPLSALAALRTRPTRRNKVVLVTHFNRSQALEWVERGRITTKDSVFRSIVKLEAEVLPQLDSIVYVSEYMKAIIRERIPGVAKVRDAVVPNFIAGTQDAPPPFMGDLISIGTLEPRKNQQFLLRVLAELKSRGLILTLTVVGDGEDRRMLEALAAELEVATQVRFLGFRAGANALVAAHRVYVHAATMESFGIVLIEALAAGVPIVAAKAGGMTEIMREGKNGCFWELTDISAAADVLAGMLGDEAKRQFMASYARADFEARFSFTTAGSHLARWMKEITS